MEKRSSTIRIIICLCLVIAIFVLFVFRLFDWQIVHGKEYQEVLKQSSTFVESSYETRGEILLADGTELAVNKTSYSVILNKIYMVENQTNNVVISLLDLCRECNVKWNDILPILVDGEGFKFDEGSTADIEFIQSESMLNDDTLVNATDIMKALIERYDVQDINDKELQRDVVSVRYNMEKKGYSYTTVYEFAKGVSKEAISVISERTQNIPAVEIRTTSEREIKNGTLIPHIVGVIGAMSPEEYEEHKDEGYALDAKIGKFGIEAGLESYLKGKAGQREIVKDYKGNIISEKDIVPAEPGNTIFLTINKNIQQVANDSLARNVKKAQTEGAADVSKDGKNHQGEDCIAGGAVMLRVKDFAVLAAATYPSYDLSQYWDEDYNEWLYTDETAPMYSRAFDGAFQPGSSYKPLVAIAGLQENTISEDFTYSCSGHYNYYEGTTINCLSSHGTNNVRNALAKSCNGFFAEVGRLTGITTLYLYSEKFGLGVKTGVEISESTGVLAGRDSEEFYPGNTCQAAIGQSDNTFTPLQLATYTATIANGGTRYRTHLVRKIQSYDRTKTILDNSPDKPEVVANAEIDPEVIQIVKEGMRGVVTTGTASDHFSSYGISLGGKTGTAENAGSDHCVFICFAPYEDPEIAVAVVLEHGTWTKYAIDTAKDMMNEYF